MPVGNRVVALISDDDVGWCKDVLKSHYGSIEIFTIRDVYAEALAEADRVFLIGSFRQEGLREITRVARNVTRVSHDYIAGPGYSASKPSQSNRLTIPEQLSLLLNDPLGEEIARQAWAWRDGWQGLSAKGVNWGDAETVVKAIAGNCPDDPQKDILQLDDLSLLLAHESQGRKGERYLPLWATRPKCKGEKGYEKIAERCLPVNASPLLVLYHQAEEGASQYAKLNKITGLEYLGPADRYDYFYSLMRDDKWRQYFTLRLSRGEFQLRFRADTDVMARHKFDELISELLSVLLVTGRPLRYYSATFHLPFKHEGIRKRLSIQENLKSVERVITPEPTKAMEDMLVGSATEEEKFAEYTEEEKLGQALVYFAPNLQQQLFQVKDKSGDESILPIHHYRLPDIPNRVVLNTSAANKQNMALPATLEAKVEEVSLFLHYDDHAVFSLRVTLVDRVESGFPSWDRPDRTTKEILWWRDLFIGERETIRQLQLECWLLFTKSVRLLYPSFAQQEEEQKIFPLQLDGGSSGLTQSQPLNTPILDLAGRFIGMAPEDLGKELLREVSSDRMFVNVACALAGPSPVNAAGRESMRRAFSLALYVDRASDAWDSQDGYAYDKNFIERRFEADVYSRWEGVGTLMGHTNYSNVYLGHGREFREYIAPVHVPYIYGRLLLLALFYQNRLRGFERDILIKVKDNSLVEQYREFSTIRERFIRFTNNYWFHLPTEQVQGRELYDRMAEKLHLKESYELVKEEIERGEDYFRAKFTTMLTQAGLLLTVIGFALALLAADSLHQIWQEPEGLIYELEPLIRISFSFGLASFLGLLVFRPLGLKGSVVLLSILGVSLIGLIIAVACVPLFLYCNLIGGLSLLAMWGALFYLCGGRIFSEGRGARE